MFGCGGNRDSDKRPKMGAVATKLADYTVITSDNPRFENPLQIIHDIERGVVSNNYSVKPNRRDAISLALDKAGKDDIIAIVGKGAEDYQEINDIKYQYSDYEVVDKYFDNSNELTK